MPLFVYQCQSCEWAVEKFLHNRKDEPTITCEKCGDQNFEQAIGCINPRLLMNANETLKNRVSPEVDRIQEKLSNGDDATFLDVAGD